MKYAVEIAVEGIPVKFKAKLDENHNFKMSRFTRWKLKRKVEKIRRGKI